MYMPQQLSVDLDLAEHWLTVNVCLKPAACTHSAVGDGVPSSLTLFLYHIAIYMEGQGLFITHHQARDLLRDKEEARP